MSSWSYTGQSINLVIRRTKIISTSFLLGECFLLPVDFFYLSYALIILSHWVFVRIHLIIHIKCSANKNLLVIDSHYHWLTNIWTWRTMSSLERKGSSFSEKGWSSEAKLIIIAELSTYTHTHKNQSERQEQSWEEIFSETCQRYWQKECETSWGLSYVQLSLTYCLHRQVRMGI